MIPDCGHPGLFWGDIGSGDYLVIGILKVETHSIWKHEQILGDVLSIFMAGGEMGKMEEDVYNCVTVLSCCPRK